MTLLAVRASAAFLACLLTWGISSHAQTMPDPKEIAGIPLPVGDVSPGTVTVRVIRGTLANNIPDQPVRLAIGDDVREQKTNAPGRAYFRGRRRGTRVTASAVVDGERLESQEFPVPASGGIRLLLVATDPEASKRADDDRRLAAAPAQAGSVVLGEQSRFVFELGDEALNVFSILQIVNTARTPVQPREPVVFEAAPNGGTVTLLKGSNPRASADGRRVVVAGPFPPGDTLVQFAYSVPYSGPAVTIEQRMPVTLNQVTVLAQKVGDMRLSSPHVAARREMAAQGETYIVAQGPGVGAGEAVSFAFDGLPHAPVWPRNVALALAAVILAGGAWSSLRTRANEAPTRARTALETRRERLFSELAAIESRRLGNADAPQYASRRRELMTELEAVYAALDN